MLFDDRVLGKENSHAEVVYLSNNDAPLKIQNIEVGSYNFHGSVQVSLRNNTGAKLTAFGIKVIPYYSDGRPADMAARFEEEIKREYTMDRISIANGRNYSDFWEPEEEDDEEEKELKMEAVMFSRAAVTNSLLSKLIPKPEKKTPIEQLEKRLNLLAH